MGRGGGGGPPHGFQQRSHGPPSGVSAAVSALRACCWLSAVEPSVRVPVCLG